MKAIGKIPPRIRTGRPRASKYDRALGYALEREGQWIDLEELATGDTKKARAIAQGLRSQAHRLAERTGMRAGFVIAQRHVSADGLYHTYLKKLKPEGTQ